MLKNIKESNIETSIVSINDDDNKNSKNELINWKYKSAYDENLIKEKNKKAKNHNLLTSKNNEYTQKTSLVSSIHHITNKNKKKKDIYKSTKTFFEKNDKREIQIGKNKIKIDEEILKKKEDINTHKRSERLFKSFKKNKSITNKMNKIDDNIQRDDSPSNKQVHGNNNYIIDDKDDDNYCGEKILINIDDFNFLIPKFQEMNNIVDYKKGELCAENKYEISKRLSCIINDSPFISSNIFFKNNECKTSIECLLGKDKCRFFEKNKNSYKGKTAKELFKKILENIFVEVDSDLNDKLYYIDPTKICVGQLYKSDEKYNNEFLKNKYMRDITNLDGNAFITAFIFNYLEQLIAKKDIKSLSEIIGKNILILKSQKKTKEEISKVLAVFKIIINYIEEDNISNAYKILIKSFSEDYYFYKIMINFMRESLSESIISHQCYFIFDYLKEITQEKYIKKNEKGILYFDYNLYIKEIINNNNELQYELLVFYFLPSIFDIDLIIYTNNDTKINKIIFKHRNNEYAQDEVMQIELFIKFGKISILYPDNFYKENVDYLPLISKYQIPLDKIKIKPNDNKINCYMCNNIPDEFILINKYFQLICRKCLAQVIQKIIEKRYLLYSDTDNSFFHEEYYCNKINYKINKDKINSYNLNLSINDIRHILPNNSDISNEIHLKIKMNHKCGKCKESFIKSKYAFNMDNCGHLICINCLKDYIIKITDEKVILNYYEYKLKQIKFFCPVCNKEIFLSKNLINNLFIDDNYKNDAEERLIEAARNICCFCHITNESKNKKIFVIINEFASSNSSINNYLLIHSICKDCEKNIKKNNLMNSSKKFFCDFCGEEHQYNKIKYDIQRKRKSCCAPM